MIMATSRPSLHHVLLGLPDTKGRDALRAGSMATQCVPVNLPNRASDRRAMLREAELLNRKLDIQARSYGLKKYSTCFVASEAIAWMTKRMGLAADTAVAIGQALGTLGLLDHAAISDRGYLGKTYPDRWVGAHAIDVLCAQYDTTRHEGHLLMQRLMQFSLIEHVVNEQPFIDGNYFYRFSSKLPLEMGRIGSLDHNWRLNGTAENHPGVKP